MINLKGITLNEKKLYFATFALILISLRLSVAQTAYVPNTRDSTITVIDVPTNTITKIISNSITSNTVSGVCVSLDGTKVYITKNDNIDSIGKVIVINTSTNSIFAIIPIGPDLSGIAVSPDGSKVYVASIKNRTVTVISTADNTVSATIPVGIRPGGIYLTPDGSKLYVVNNFSNNVSVINTSTNIVATTIPVGNFPWGICVSPDGSKVYVSSHDSIRVINTITNAVIAIIPVSDNPSFITITPDGSKVYVCDVGSNSVSTNDSTIMVINPNSNTVSDTIEIGGYPAALGNFISSYSQTVGVLSEDIELDNISIFPNPTSGQFTIALSVDKSEIIVTDLFGQLILKTQTTQKKTNLQLNKNGCFIVNAKTKHGMTKRLLFVNR
jgi:YVTN family beta-propeller protein